MSSRSFLFSAVQTFVECYAKFEGGKVANVLQIIFPLRKLHSAFNAKCLVSFHSPFPR